MRYGTLALSALLISALSPFCQAQSIGTNFTGTTLFDAFNLGTAGFPPDTDGSVGINHYVSFINGAFSVYNKTNGTLATSRITDTAFWANAGIDSNTLSQGLSDTRIIYDQGSQRWFATEITTSDTGNSLLVARSNTSDPTQGFKAVSIVAANSSTFADFDTLGVNHDSVQVGTNNFVGSNGFNTQLISIPKADLLLGAPTASNSTIFSPLNLNGGITPQSATDFGSSNGHATVLSADFTRPSNPSSTLHGVDVNGSGAAAATLSSVFNVTVQNYSYPGNDATQPGSGAYTIDSGDSRIGAMVYKVGDNIYSVRGTDVNGRAGVRWTIISDSTNKVIREGTISDPNHDYIMPSIAANSAGNIVIGFTRTGTTEFASAYAVTGTTDANGNVTFGGPLLLKAGTSTYTAEGTGTQRWGDYSATGVDPLNANSFWTTQEFATTDVNGSSIWATQVTQINFAAAPVPEASTLYSISLMALLGAGCFARQKRLRKTA